MVFRAFPIPRRHHVPVPAADDENNEAVRLNLAQIAAAPDAWRARAISAGGFLGAAAAVTLWSLSGEGARVSGPAGLAVAGSAICYLAAVIIFLIASILPAPKIKDAGVRTAAEQLHDAATQESRPIKIMVFIGAGIGSLAIALTSVGILLVLMMPVREQATVMFSDSNQRDAAKLLCPGLGETFEAEITDDGSDMLQLTVGDNCIEKRTEILVPRDAIIQTQTD